MSAGRTAQRGAALLVSLILLVVITLVGLAAIGITLIQNKAASNQFDRQIAFQAAEAGLRQAQVAIQNAAASTPAPAGFEDCSSTFNPGPPPVWTPNGPYPCLANPFKDPNVSATQVVTVPTSLYTTALAAAPPQYVVQYLGKFASSTATATLISNSQNYGVVAPSQLADYYRITARSGNPALTGERSVVTLQSTFRN